MNDELLKVKLKLLWEIFDCRVTVCRDWQDRENIYFLQWSVNEEEFEIRIDEQEFSILKVEQDENDNRRSSFTNPTSN